MRGLFKRRTVVEYSGKRNDTMEDKTLTLSVIIPCYNEKQTIEEIVKRVKAVDLASEIVIVDDGSQDGTRDILEALKEDPIINVVLHSHNQGKGAAVRTGFAAAKCDIVLIQDADLEYDPRDYPALIRPIREGIANVVYGSRFRGGPTKTMFFWNMIANRSLTLMTNILYNTILTDMETCYKVFRREVVQQIPLRARGFELEPEITAKVLKRGHRIYEVPISYNGREWEEGKKIKWYDAPKAAWTLLRYRFTD